MRVERVRFSCDQRAMSTFIKNPASDSDLDSDRLSIQKYDSLICAIFYLSDLVHRLMKVTLTMAMKINIIITVISKLVSGN